MRDFLPQEVGQRDGAGAWPQDPLLPTQQFLHQGDVPGPGGFQQLLLLPHPGHKFATTGWWKSNKSPINPPPLRPLSLTAWCWRASERIPLTACCCCCCTVIEVLLMLQSRFDVRCSPGCLLTSSPFTRFRNHYSPRCKPQCKQAQQGGGRGNLEAPRRNPQWEVKSKPGSNKKQTNSVSVRTKNAAPGRSEAPAANTRDVKPSTRSSPGPATLSTSLPRTYRTDWPVPVGVARDTRVKLTGIKLRTSCCGFQNKTSTRWYVTSFCL